MMGLSSLECLLETNSCLGVCELKSTKIKHYVTIVSATCECLRIRKTQDQNVPHASVSCGLFHPYCTSYDPEDEPKGRQLQRCKIRWGEAGGFQHIQQVSECASGIHSSLNPLPPCLLPKEPLTK
eukprot:scaffold134159_cov18-Tisochrysis_lutea.AAC.1